MAKNVESLDPAELAADDDGVLSGVEAPSVEEQLEYLADHGWPA